MKTWYYAQNGIRTGPVDKSTVESLYQSGAIKPADLVWEEGMPDWVRADSVLHREQPEVTSETPPMPALATPIAQPLPDYGEVLCWGILAVCIPIAGWLALIALMVLYITELNAARRGVLEGRVQRSSYTELHPILIGLMFLLPSCLCCPRFTLPVLYPLVIHWRNGSKLFKPQPHALVVSIVAASLCFAILAALTILQILVVAATTPTT